MIGHCLLAQLPALFAFNVAVHKPGDSYLNIQADKSAVFILYYAELIYSYIGKLEQGRDCLNLKAAINPSCNAFQMHQ
jgi:hypothetical protein